MAKPVRAYQGHEPPIFICYSHLDKKRVYSEIQWLDEAGYPIWYDEDIRPTSEWSDALAQAIETCRAFIFFLTPNSVASEYCRREINYALSKNRKIVTIRLEETEIPGGLSLLLDHRQAIVYEDHSQDTYRQIVREALSAIEAGTEPPRPSSLRQDKPARWLKRNRLSAAIAVLSFFGLVAWLMLNESTGPESEFHSIAVLPLVNLSGDPGQEYFADGTTDLLIQDLGNVVALRVVSRQSVMRYKGSTKSAAEIAQELGVKTLLTGSVAAVDDRVRVAVQLYDAISDRNIWSNRYHKELSNILVLQADIARAVVAEINVELSGNESQTLASERSVDPMSHRAYLRGRSYAQRFQTQLARAELESAIQLDPQNVEALVELAKVLHLEAWVGPIGSMDLLQLARAYTERALTMAPQHRHARAHAALIAFFMDGEYQDAIDVFHDLLEENPNDTDVYRYYSLALKTVQRQDLVDRMVGRWIDLDPLDPSVYQFKGEAQLLQGQVDDARATLELGESMGECCITELLLAALTQRDQRAMADYVEILEERRPHLSRFWRGVTALAQGDLERFAQTMQAVIQAEGPEPWHVKSIAALYLQNTELALMFTHKAIDAREPTALMSLLGTPQSRLDLPQYYGHPKFEQIVNSAGLGPDALARLIIPGLPF